MRGNLVWKNTERTTIDFVEDANGEYEVVDGGRITQRNKSIDEYRKIKDDFMFFGIDPRTKQEQPESTLKKDYVITAFKIGEQICGLNGYNQYADSKGVGTDLELCLKCDCPIYRVKRKSDNEEFSADEITEQGKIKRFRNSVTDSNVLMVDFYEYPVSQEICILTKKKDKQVLFTVGEIKKILLEVLDDMQK